MLGHFTVRDPLFGRRFAVRIEVGQYVGMDKDLSTFRQRVESMLQSGNFVSDQLHFCFGEGAYLEPHGAVLAAVQDLVTHVQVTSMCPDALRMLTPHALPRLTDFWFSGHIADGSAGSDALALAAFMAPRVTRASVYDVKLLAPFEAAQKLEKVVMLPYNPSSKNACTALGFARRTPSLRFFAMCDYILSEPVVAALGVLNSTEGAPLTLGYLAADHGTDVADLLKAMPRGRVHAVADYNDHSNTTVLHVRPPPAPIKLPNDHINPDDPFQVYLGEHLVDWVRDTGARHAVLAWCGATPAHSAVARFLRADGDRAAMWRVVQYLLPPWPVLDRETFLLRRPT
jgi:hypothetical protein